MKSPLLEEIRKTEKSYCVVTLCSGIGGSSIGYEMAGFQVCVAVDQNPKSNEIHRMNMPHIPNLETPIECLWKSDFLNGSFHLLDGIDVLDVYIPKRFIYATKMDQSNTFFQHVLRLTYQLRPKVIVFHTQRKSSNKKHLLVINDLLVILKNVGYTVYMETLKASSYGIPQEKAWLFILGVRKDYGFKPSFPEPHETVVTTKEAIADLLEQPADVEASSVRLEMAQKYFPPGCTYGHVKRMIQEFDLPVHPAYYKRDCWDKPYYALPNSSIRPFHPVANRLLSIQEAKRLQTFPDDFLCSDWKEICSSVPPLLIMQVAKELKQSVLKYMD